MKHFIIIFLTMLFISSCQDEEIHQNKVKEILSRTESKISHEAKNILIIPDAGCPGCVASGISFVKEHYPEFNIKQKNNLVIFTNIKSFKLLKRQLGSLNIENLNAIVDSTNRFLIDSRMNIYPIIINKSQDNKLKKIAFQTPHASELSNFHYILTDKTL